MEHLKHFLQQKAKQLGFSIIKFVQPKILSSQKSLLQQWLANNYHATMDYLARNIEKRTDPFLLFDDLRSIVVLAYEYPANVIFSGTSPNQIITSKYATQPDYHFTIKNKLISLCDAAKCINSDIIYKCFVDSGIVMEKQWAVEAGVGWQGKNTLIVNEDIGSFFHLAVIFLNIEIEPDTSVPNRCGSCNLCIDACPTKALIQPNVIDCNLCISYRTIENAKSNLSEKKALVEKAIKESGYVFGCDICQDVCPWNKKRLQEAPLHCNFDKEIINWTEEDFLKNFTGSPIIRAGYEQFMANVKLVLSGRSI